MGDHTDPQQRMMQLMFQQRQIQQMANQAAIAMSYFMQQNGNAHGLGNSNSNLHTNMHHQQQIGSLSSIHNSMANAHMDRLDDAFIDTEDLPPELPPSMAEHDDMLGNENENNFAFKKSVKRQSSNVLLKSAFTTKRDSMPPNLPELPNRQSTVDDLFG